MDIMTFQFNIQNRNYHIIGATLKKAEEVESEAPAKEIMTVAEATSHPGGSLRFSPAED